MLEIIKQKTASKVRISLFAGTVPENRENGWGVKNIYSIRPTNTVELKVTLYLVAPAPRSTVMTVINHSFKNTCDLKKHNYSRTNPEGRIIWIRKNQSIVFC